MICPLRFAKEIEHECSLFYAEKLMIHHGFQSEKLGFHNHRQLIIERTHHGYPVQMQTLVDIHVCNDILIFL
jgi:hypothetical protein